MDITNAAAVANVVQSNRYDGFVHCAGMKVQFGAAADACVNGMCALNELRVAVCASGCGTV